MAYRYKQYINRAFWNSLVAVLSALVVVLIVVYGWSTIQATLTEIISGDDSQSEEGALDSEEERMRLLESLRGESNMSEQESDALLNALQSNDEEQMSEEERMQLLESLRQS